MTGAAAMRWLREVTGESSTRHIGEKIGRSHATVQRWAKHGIPPRSVLQLVIENDYDLMDALEMLGWMSPTERDRIAPTLDKLPTPALTAELQRLAGVVHDRVSESDPSTCR